MPTTKRAASNVARRRKTAVASAGDAQLQPTYPVKPWVDAGSGLSYHTVSVQLDGGNYLWIIAEFPQIRVTAALQADAERKAIEIYQHRPANPQARYTEDEALSIQCDRADAEGYTSAKSFLKDMGYGVDGRRLS